mgnify:FL=1
MRFPFHFMALVSVVAVSQLAGCASSPKLPEPSPTVLCEEPRPQICTMIYAPVCATHGDGRRQTHASDCNACADDSTVSYEVGACDGEATP